MDLDVPETARGELGPHDRESQFPQMRGLISVFSAEDDFAALYLEFVLYARRNPVAREKLIASARRERAKSCASGFRLRKSWGGA